VNNILQFEPAPSLVLEADSPTRRRIRTGSRVLATALFIASVAAICAALALVCAIVMYNGPLLAFGSGGVWIGGAANGVPGLLPLTAFSSGQRLVGALAIVLLALPILLILGHTQILLRRLIVGNVFGPENARSVRFLGASLAFYAVAPLVAHRIVLLAGITNDPIWFHVDELIALALGALLFIVAAIAEFGGEIERERDGFV
jgi:uncharacterized protein (DUF779 family)